MTTIAEYFGSPEFTSGRCHFQAGSTLAVSVRAEWMHLRETASAARSVPGYYAEGQDGVAHRLIMDDYGKLANPLTRGNPFDSFTPYGLEWWNDK